MKRILLVHADKKPWATQRRAEALKREWKDDEVDIVDRWNLPKVNQYDIIHILFSGGITKIKDFILENKHKTYATLASQRTLDCLWDKKEDLIEIYENVCHTVCHNTDLAFKLSGLIHKVNITCIPNGVDTKLFKNDFFVGYVGSKGSEKHKGFDIIVQVCKDLKLPILVANVPYKFMPEFYRRISCLVVASKSEGCNNPTLEALAMNVPVISTEVGIVNELEGVTIVDRDVESIKDALENLCSSIQMREYSWNKVAKEYHELYEQ